MHAIPTIQVHRVLPWETHESLEDLVTAAQHGIDEATSKDCVSEVIDSIINSIKWDDTAFSMIFPNGRSLMLSVSGSQILLSPQSKNYGPQPMPLRESAYLKFENISEPFLWKRAEILQRREVRIFKGIQLSGSTAFVYTQGQEPLMLSILECLDEQNQLRSMLHWANVT